MARTYEAWCDREPELPVVARLATPMMRDLTGADDEVVVEGSEFRFGSASVQIQVTGREPVGLRTIAENPESTSLALVTAVFAALEYHGYLGTDPPPEERQLARRAFRSRYGPVLTAEHLGELLAEAGTEAAALAREALLAGTTADLPDRAGAAWAARSRYGRRERTSRRAGQGSVGFETALRALGAYPGVALTHAQIDDRSRERYFFEVFLTPDFSRVIACFGVARPQASRAPDAPPWSRLDEIVLRTIPEAAEKVAALREEGVSDVAAGLVAGLEKYLATRGWSYFGRYAELVPAFPSPEAARYLTAALEDPYLDDALIAIVEDALAVVSVRPGPERAR
ncbi:hypothetical protein ACIA5G_48560 [Amycolatopsis sp. NPDC051758]|uniref:hypothetical protein n=1 Tax=Amycolatopsis sp. NPDC051758 TaxID=3363935 RepID=UPI00379F17E5